MVHYLGEGSYLAVGCKVSIVIPVYQSHEALRRQALYWQSLNLPDDVEIIIVDDGSDPPLEADGVRFVRTNRNLAWTQDLGRNQGAEAARGDILLMTDIDHILSRGAIMASMVFTGARLQFPRYFGVLLEDGSFTDDLDTLIDYGFDTKRLGRRGLYASFHGNTWAIPRSVFMEIGGYTKSTCIRGYHPGANQGPDCHFNRKWNRWAKKRGVRAERGPRIYMFPIGRYHKDRDNNPFGMFHNLSYEHKKMWKHGNQD